MIAPIGKYMFLRDHLQFGLRLWFFPLGIMMVCSVNAQNESYNGFVPLDNYYGASGVALSGTNGSRSMNDVNQWGINPGILTGTLNGEVGVNSSFYPSKISVFSLTSVLQLDSIWPIGVRLLQTSFGETDRYDAEGRNIGTFRSSSSSISLGTSRALSQDLRIGIALNYHLRNIDSYNSHILSVDIGSVYSLGDNSAVGLSISNLGHEIIPFETERTPINWDLSIYGSKKLRYLPLELFLKFQKLNFWNRLSYLNPFDESQNDFDNGGSSESSRIENLVREIFAHMVVGGQMSFGKPEKFWLRFSYDHLQNRQLGIENIRSLEGIALGFGIAVKELKIDYSWERLYFDAGVHHLSLSLNIFGDKKVAPRRF